MQKKKKEYVAPDITVTQVEVESAICGGSPENVTANAPGASANSQEVNSEFNKTVDGSALNTWTSSDDWQ